MPVHHLRYRQKWLIDVAALALGDALALGCAMLLAGGLRAWWLGGHMLQEWFLLLPPAWWIVALAGRLLPGWGLGAVEELRRAVLLMSLLFGGALVILFFMKQSSMASRLTLAMAYGGSLVLLPALRTRVKGWLIRRDRWGVPTVIYGAGETGCRIIRALREEPGLGYLPMALCDDDPRLWGQEREGLTVRNPADASLQEGAVAILALPRLPQQRMAALIDGPLLRYRQVILIPDLVEIPTLWVQSRSLAGILGLEISQTLLDPLAQVLKRTLDLGVVLLTAPLWGPLCLVITAAVWLTDRHAPFFIQERVGRQEKVFHLYKFRTMVPHAERVLSARLDRDPGLRAEWESAFKLRKDPRVTRIGRWLRRFSLDELPQMINILRGEMSLVGPRPLPPYHHQQLPERLQQLRHRVLPGMTGLWQISGRSDAGNEGMIRWDAYYVRNWSIWLDVVILVRTLRVVLRGKGAY